VQRRNQHLALSAVATLKDARPRDRCGSETFLLEPMGQLTLG
jgi:hypothetical protein